MSNVTKDDKAQESHRGSLLFMKLLKVAIAALACATATVNAPTQYTRTREQAADKSRATNASLLIDNFIYVIR